MLSTMHNYSPRKSRWDLVILVHQAYPLATGQAIAQLLGMPRSTVYAMLKRYRERTNVDRTRRFFGHPARCAPIQRFQWVPQNDRPACGPTIVGPEMVANMPPMVQPMVPSPPIVQNRMMTMDVTKPEPPSVTAGMGGGPGVGGSSTAMALTGLVPAVSAVPQQQQQQAPLGPGPGVGTQQPGPGVGPGGQMTGGAQHPQQQQQQQQQPQQSQQLCAGCGKHIQDRFLLRALDLLWHEDCLKCGCCDCRLGEVGSTLYTKGNLMLCKRDYLRLFGNTGFCAACNKVIPAFEMVMRARNNVYHLECFACQQCNHRFCVGDKFYLCENKILCEYDYEERLVFASMANHPMLKRQMSQGGGASGGGGAGASGSSGSHSSAGGSGGGHHPGMQNGHGGGGGGGAGGAGGGGSGGGGGGGGGGAGGGAQQGMLASPQQQNGTNGNPMMGLASQRGGAGAGGDHNNNNNNSLSAALAGGPSPFGTPAHLKATLSTAS